ncbi:uncharacterized protein (TIGR02594 family) [Rhizobium leguminosarum]
MAERLKVRGFAVAAQGDAGARGVTASLKAFQQAFDLPLTGIADQATINELRRDPSPNGHASYNVVAIMPVEPAWMREARRFIGLKEIPGAKSSSTILGWAKALGGWIASFYKDDDTPWCGLFMAHCFGSTLPDEILPSNPLSALAWSDFGAYQSAPNVGSLLVFSREGGGHVGLYVGEDADSYHVLGGNQGNSVKVSPVLKRRCVAIRWPKTGDRPAGGCVLLKANGEVSRNEA